MALLYASKVDCAKITAHLFVNEYVAAGFISFPSFSLNLPWGSTQVSQDKCTVAATATTALKSKYSPSWCLAARGGTENNSDLAEAQLH